MSRDLARRVAILEAAPLPAPVPASEFPGGARAELLRRLGTLAARLRSDPGWREPSRGEAVEGAAAVRAFLADRFDATPAGRLAAASAGAAP